MRVMVLFAMICEAKAKMAKVARLLIVDMRTKNNYLENKYVLFFPLHSKTWNIDN